jgi:hypothetical protein
MLSCPKMLAYVVYTTGSGNCWRVNVTNLCYDYQSLEHK